MKTPLSLLKGNNNVNNRGIAIVYIAILLVALFAFVGLAIDIGYMYVTKTQLQNAADSAALAGAAKLTGEDDTSSAAFIQTDARREAWKFACNNKATLQNVFIQTNSSLNCTSPPSVSELNASTNADTGDIIVGNWNSTSSIFTRANGSTGLSINAIFIKARRTKDSPGGDVKIFFGRILNYPSMAASSSAIATLALPGVAPLPICLPSCSLKTPVNGQWDYDKKEDHPFLCTDKTATPSGQRYFLSPSAQDASEDPNYPITGSAWTNFYISECFGACNQPITADVIPYLHGQIPPPTCDKRICTSNGALADVVKKDFTDAFNKNKKSYIFLRPTNITTGPPSVTVQAWQVIVPVVSDTACGGGTVSQACPGDRLGDPYVVKKYAKVLITEIVDSEKKGFRLIGLGRDYVPDTAIQTTSFSQTVTCGKTTTTVNRWITFMDCIDCNDPSLFSGSVAKLVK